MAPGYEVKDDATGPPLVIDILKSLYGLKQNLKNFHVTIDTFLVGIGFKVLKRNPCVYIFNGTTTMKQEVVTNDDLTAICIICQKTMTDLDFKDDSKCVPLHICNTPAHIAGNQTYRLRAKRDLEIFGYSRDQGGTRNQSMHTDGEAAGGVFVNLYHFKQMLVIVSHDGHFSQVLSVPSSTGYRWL